LIELFAFHDYRYLSIYVIAIMIVFAIYIALLGQMLVYALWDASIISSFPIGFKKADTLLSF